MAFSIEQLLGFVPLTAAVEQVKQGVPRVLPDVFYRRNPGDRVLGNKARLVNYKGTRQNARLAPYGAPPRQIVQLERSQQDIILLHTIEKLALSQELMLQLRELDNYVVQNMARTEINFQAMGAATRMTNLESSAVHVALANGKLWFDVDGNLLATSSGADLEVDYGIPANNLNQLNGIITASWATASTPIVQHVNNIKMRAAQTTGYPLKYALYGKNVAQYLADNTSFQQYLARNSNFNQKWVDTGTIPPGVLDLTWVNVQNAFFADSSGTVTEIFGADTVVFCPDVNPMTWSVYEGSYNVPKSLGAVMSDVVAMLDNVNPQYGPFGYAMMDGPNSITGVYGDTFLPRFKVPEAFFIADVTP
jgi:hypothetical protein